MKLFKLNILVISISLLSTVAIAGHVETAKVHINDDWKLAQGMAGAIRNSKDDVESLHCTVTARPGSSVYANCYARNTSGVTRSCYSRDWRMIDTVRSITSSSYINFRWGDDGSCTEIIVGNGSVYGVKGS